MRKLLLIATAVALLAGCGDAPQDVEQKTSAYTRQCYGFTCFIRPATNPPGTDCPIRWYSAQMIGPIYLQDWCVHPDYALYDKAQICAWNRNDANNVGFQGINNSWCGELPLYTGFPDLAPSDYQFPTGNWPWQLSSMIIGSHIQVALCTEANYTGNCWFFGRQGNIPGNFFGDIRAYTTDPSTGKPWPHMSLFVQ